MGGGRKRKISGGGPTKSRKRRTPEAAIPTRQEECFPTSDIDEPQVEDIIKVELELDVDPGRDDDHQEFFDDSSNQDLTLSPDIDIGEVDVKVLQYPETEAELTREEEEVHGVDLNMINEAESIGPDIGVLSIYSISKPSDFDGSVRPTEYELGSTLEDEDGGDDTAAAATIVGTHYTEGTAAMEKLQGMPPGSGGSRKEVLSILRAVTTVNQKDEKNAGNLLSTIQENDGQSGQTTRLTKELQAATSQIECLQRNVNSKSSRIQELSSKIKQLDDKVLNGAVECKGLKAELDKARKRQEEATGEIDELKNSILEKENELDKFKARYFRDEEENSQLHLAVKIGDAQAVEDLIQLGAEVNAENNDAVTPIFLVGASEVDDKVALRIVTALIKHGANVFATDREGQTFLHKFASAESPVTPSQFHEISSHLVSKNLSSLFITRSKTPCNGSTPLMLAAVNAKLQPRTASFLHENIKNGIDFTLKDYRGKSLLCYAVEVHNTQKLLSGTINPEQTNEAGGEELVKLLVELGADANETSLLHGVAESKNRAFAINIVKFLINSGADGEAKDTYGDTFLQRLLARSTTAINPTQFHDMAAFLISKGLSRLFNTRGCDHCGRDCTDGTQFQNAVNKVEIKRATLSLLKANGVDLNAVDRSGYRVSVLYSAISGNRTLKVISDLVDLGADPMFVTSTRWNETMLHIAASKGRHDLLKFFLDKGLDVNAHDEYGYTPLHKALSCSPKANVFKTIQILLRNGANSDVKNKAGSWCESLSPFEYFEDNIDEFSDADKISTCFSLGSSCGILQLTTVIRFTR